MSDHIINFLSTLSARLKKSNFLNKQIAQFASAHNLQPCFGVEIEFFATDGLNINALSKAVGLDIKAERGRRQFEIMLPPSVDLKAYAQQINDVMQQIKSAAMHLGGGITFAPKPFLDDYGSSMQFNLSFATLSDSTLEIAARSLCHFMLETFLIFMPHPEDYARIDARFMAPTCVSFGGNNRSCALRIPDALPKRLEHRVASPLVDPYLAMSAILKSVFLGLKDPDALPQLKKIYGNAHDAQYNLPKFPTSLEQSFELFNTGFFKVC